MSDSMTRRVMMRLWITAAVMLLAVVAVVARAVNLQVMETEFLQSRGEAHYLRAVDIPTVRGTIFDRTGEPLAVSTPVESVWAHPGELLQAADHIPMLAGLLESDADELERKLMQRAGREFVWLRRRINPDLADKIRALDVPGVFLQREYMRFYPGGEVMAQVLGFTNIDDIGQEGLELAYNESLRGRPGRKRVIKDRLGRVVQNVEMISEARPGQDLHLTIDRRLQYLAFRDLKTRVIEYGAESGTVVVLGAKTGEILAMANYPSYNPNSVTRAASDGLRNRAVTDVLEPGSVMKPFAVAAAMEAGIAQREMIIDTSPGVISVSSHRIRDTRDFGELTVEGVLTKSSNVGVVQLALAMDARHLWSVYSRFGFGVVAGTGFPGESAGVLRDHERWRKLEQATLAYGYGLSVTPLQLARAMAAIADGGRLREPTFIANAGNSPHSVLDPDLAWQLAVMLETVTGPEGTGSRARVEGYRVAGKTGTSRKAAAGSYGDRYIGSFVGFAPVSDPELVVAVIINDPDGETFYGGQVAAPLFSEVMAAGLRLFDVPPDDPELLMAQLGGAHD